jgi:hypothetical protein
MKDLYLAIDKLKIKQDKEKSKCPSDVWQTSKKVSEI